MLVEFIEELLINRKKYLGALGGFLFGLILIQYGFVKMLIVLAVTCLGYNLGDLEKIKKIKKILITRLKED
ncbi:DUF2273 domain-containing protein [Ilyobacter sp.]|uniref:DUF2273 domain-containing protein n=1 Tax=Ilyobacter sp. TaxID=3100343 RepID=UPI0035687681